MNKPKINSEIKNNLFSPSPEVVISAIQKIKDKGNKEYLPMLFELLLAGPEMEVRKEILKLLGTIKDKETIPAYIEALQNVKFKEVKKEILTTCWQNGLDFSEYLDVFVDIVIDCDWEIAFEAFTVIENQNYFPPEEELRNIKLKIAGVLKTADEQKRYFLEEILKMSR
ncbi:MAG: HEAT repeat domain-containing protein [Bacteroidota bacterium]